MAGGSGWARWSQTLDMKCTCNNDVWKFSNLDYFLNKIRCTENYLELHEIKNICENPIQ